MAAGAAMVTGGVAGCLGGSSGDDGTITTFHSSIPTEMNFNTWAPSYPWNPTWLLLEPVLRYYSDGSISHEMIEDWEYDENSQELTVHHNDEFYWWNGDVVNAADKYWYGEVARLLNPDSSDYEQLSLENNGQTIIREYKEPQNPQLVEYNLGGYLGAMMRGHRDKFRPWAEELQDASTEEERVDIEKRMVEEMPLHISTVADEGLGMGPFEIVDFDEQGIHCELYDEHPYADQINIDKLEYVLAADEAVAQQIMGGDLDFGFGRLSNWIGDQNPDNVEMLAPYQDTFMRKLEFMMQGPAAEHMRTLEVRRAIAHVINFEHVSTNFTPESTVRSRQTGLPELVTEDKLGDSVDDFIDYPTETDEDGAAELMESAGYERDGGSWLDDGGDTVALEIAVPQWADNPARTVTDQLTQFGFEVDLSVLEGATYNDRTENSVDFDMTMGNHGALIAHPSYYFRPTHKHGNDLGDANVIEGALEDGRDRSPYNGKELIVEIPTEIGREDLSGSTEEVNPYELYQEWMTTQSEERNQELVETFARYWNFHLPGIDLFEMMGGSWGNTNNWEFDVNDEWKAYRGAFRAAKRGYISPK
ncbi:ABC transporter substrate-binding protein (plasmid) [Natrinema zhouii]|uniref:ABC transporter substrate-binding protein n=1 Tax=Natrinema zhouii TaxID=1710539 RepID=UPI001CFFE407|nr:ABC transporter substrate-binding protein [Natrinema zhouii]UHQ98541.1 ABC transporter substrate-binding protein [Natrinema zhouii]